MKPFAEGFFDRIEAEPNSGCWIWIGATSGSNDYGLCYPQSKKMFAHRWSFEYAHGPIPSGMTIDHLCRVRRCVNPSHMEVVTNEVNVLRGRGHTAINARKIVCSAGHPFDERNTRIRPSTRWRACRECNRLRWHRNKNKQVLCRDA